MGRACGEHLQQNSRRKLLFAASILSSCFLLSQSQTETIPVTAEPATPRRGGTVILKPGRIPDNSTTCRWYRGRNDGRNLIIVYYLADPADTKGADYTGRETIGRGCSLHITNLNANDSGIYTLNINRPKAFTTGSAKIKVVETLPKPTLSPARYTALENENVTLHCAISSSTDFDIAWFRNSLPVPTKAFVSEDKKTLTLHEFTRDDAGTYTCVASNLLDKEASNPSEIALAYPPPSSYDGLSGAAMAGTILGCLAGIMALAGTLFCFFRRGRHQHKKIDSGVIPPPTVYENTGANPDSSSRTSNTYEQLQYKDQAVYQVIN